MGVDGDKLDEAEIKDSDVVDVAGETEGWFTCICVFPADFTGRIKVSRAGDGDEGVSLTLNCG
jgi:hypothetical protein